MNLHWVIFLKVMWEEAEIERVAVIKETEGIYMQPHSKLGPWKECV